jgi:hypothetical protein
MRGGGKFHGFFTLGKNPRYPFQWRLEGPRGRSGLVHKILSATGFEPRTVQLVGHYTDCAMTEAN